MHDAACSAYSSTTHHRDMRLKQLRNVGIEIRDVVADEPIALIVGGSCGRMSAIGLPRFAGDHR